MEATPQRSRQTDRKALIPDVLPKFHQPTRQSDRHRVHRDAGQGMLEYGLILALIALVVISVVTVVGRQAKSSLCRVGTSLGGSGCYSVLRAGGSGADRGMAITTAADGTSYLYGRYTGTATIGNRSFTSVGDLDLFLARISPGGAWDWVVSMGGAGADYPSSGMAIDSGGNVVLGGNYNAGITFPGSSVSFTGAGMFVAKISPSGTWLWARNAATGSGITGTGGAGVDSSGNVYTAGSNSGAVSFPGSAFTLAAPLGTNGTDAFMAKLSSDGNWVWVQPGGTGATTTVTDIAVDSAGNASINGHMTGSSSFGGRSLPFLVGPYDTFIARMNPDGAWQWAASAEGGYNYSWAVTADNAGNSVVAGNYGTPAGTVGATFTSVSGSTLTLPPGPNISSFVAKIGPTGTWIWAKAPTGNGVSSIYAMTADGAGNVYVGMMASGTSIVLGTIEVGPSAGLSDMVVARLSPDGAWQWASRAGGLTDENVRAAAVDASGALYIAGAIRSDSGPITFGPTTVTSVGDQDAVIVRWNPDGTQTGG